MADSELPHTPTKSILGPKTSADETEPAKDEVEEDVCPIREHEPLDHLLRSLPHKVQQGLFSVDIDYTCLDVSSEFIALGSSVGKVFLYDRLAQTLQRLKCQQGPQSRLEVITAVRMRQSVDYVVAAGTTEGLVYIFQLPSYLPGRVKQLHMFVVEGIHVGKVTCLEWSPNAEKLFSADYDGNVVCTEIDYAKNQSKSFTFCQEPHPVIQLSYAYRTLLVSTTFRTILCFNNPERRVKKIGTKDRKILGDFGACFMPDAYTPEEEPALYCARPGLRLWRATLAGTVATTYMFRDLVHAHTPPVRLLGDTAVGGGEAGVGDAAGPGEEVNFGKMYALGAAGRLVTHGARGVLVLDPVGGRLLGWARRLGEVRALAVCAEEVYILRRCGAGVGAGAMARRPLIRLAPTRDRLIDYLPGERSSYLPTSTPGCAPSSPAHHLLQQTAEMMQHGLLAALQGVSDKIQEGQQLASSVPPWGKARGPPRQSSGEDPDVDSCREASSASSGAASSVNSPNHPVPEPGNLTPAGECAEPAARTDLQMESGLARPPPEEETSRQQCWGDTDLQPEIHLDSDDMISIHIPHRMPDTSSEGTRHVDSSSPSQDDGVVQKEVSYPAHSDSVSATPDNDDIVFSHTQTKKQKRRKPKSQISKRLSDDVHSVDSLDIVSITSVDSGVDGILRSLSSSPVPDSGLATPGNIPDKSGPESDYSLISITVPPSSEPELLLLPTSLSVSGSGADPDHASSLPPIQNLAELGLSEIKIKPKRADGDCGVTALAGSVTPDPVPPVLPTGDEALADLLEASSEQKEERAERPQAFSPLPTPTPPPIVGRSQETAGVLGGDRVRSPGRFETFQSPYEHDPGPAASVTSALNTCSFHEEMNQMSFESYAARNLESASSTGSGPATVPASSSAASPPALPGETPLGTHGEFYQTSDSSDDFYAKYQKSASNYSLDDIYSSVEGALGGGGGRVESLENALDYSCVTQESVDARRTERPGDTGTDAGLDAEPDAGLDVEKDAGYQFSDTWTEMRAPGNLQSMCLTNRHIWVVDKSDRLHYSLLSGPGLRWRKEDKPAQQIAVSWGCSIVWRLYQGSVYAGTKITTRAPAGLSWVEVLRKEVVFIAVDESTAWYIKSSGDIMMQKGLSRDRPSFRSLKVPTNKLRLKQICCHSGVVWGLTEGQELVFRAGVTSAQEEGTSWEAVQSDAVVMKVSSVAFGENGVAWVLDLAARVWFTTGVSQSTPAGSGKWWEVSISEYIMDDSGCALSVRQMANLVVPSCENGGILSAGQAGVWVSRGFKHVLHICRSSLVGHHWESAGPSGMAQSAQWHLVSASSVTKTNGLVWTQQPNGAIFAFQPLSGKAMEVSQPQQDMSPFVCLSAAAESVWGLTPSGQVFIRAGMAAHCLHGLSWVRLNLMQLGGEHLVHLSCGSQNVWAVDASGVVYLRIGNRPPDNMHLSPAWVPVEGTTHQAGARFTKVFASSVEWMVWAVDTKKCVYVRKGVTDSMPIGTHWLYIPGTMAEEMTLSESLVYALNLAGELLIRYGVQEENPAGDYWKKVPGTFKTISVTTSDNLWAINLEGQLTNRTTQFIKRKNQEPPVPPTRANVTISDDWEVI